MNYEKVSMFLTALAVKYPGGSHEFKNSGGRVTAIPNPSNDIVVTHSNLPESIESFLIEMQERNLAKKEPYPVIQKIPNFNEEDSERRKNVIRKLLKEFNEIDKSIAIFPEKAVLIISANKINSKAKKAGQIRNIVKSLDISLSYICFEDIAESFKGSLWQD